VDALLLAMRTGLRRSRLAALKRGDVSLDAVTPFVDVRASTTKNGKPAAIRANSRTWRYRGGDGLVHRIH
jgi:integrase